MQLPAPKMIPYETNTKVILYSTVPFNMIPKEEKIWATFMHACIMHIQGNAMTNKSLRDRFGLANTASASISRLIKETLRKELIKPFDESVSSNRMMKYIPFYA